MILTYSVSARPITPVPLPVYMICFFVEDRPLEIGFTAISLVYGTKHFSSLRPHIGDTHPDHPPDSLAFSVIGYLVVRSNVYRVPIPTLLKTIVRDATYYFLVIFSSQLALMMFLLFASVSILS